MRQVISHRRHFRLALKAYHQTRDRYLAGLPQQRAFNQIGARPQSPHATHGQKPPFPARHDE